MLTGKPHFCTRYYSSISLTVSQNRQRPGCYIATGPFGRGMHSALGRRPQEHEKIGLLDMSGVSVEADVA